MKPQDLIVPVYLNQRIVFDLIAMMQDGMSAVTRVTTEDSNKEKADQRYGGSFGLSEALSSLLKIDISGDYTKGKEKGVSTQKSEERVHTPSSMFHKLLQNLEKNELVKEVTIGYKPESGDLVKFKTTLQRNSMIRALESFLQVMKMATSFEEKPNKSNKHLHRPNQLTENEKIQKQIEGFHGLLRTSSTIDMASPPLNGGFRAVVTLEQEYLNDPSMADLVDGEFTVFGKVIRYLPDESESINLLRKEFIGSVSEQSINPMIDLLRAPAITNFMNVPEIEIQIHGPALHVIPVAIFT